MSRPENHKSLSRTGVAIPQGTPFRKDVRMKRFIRFEKGELGQGMETLPVTYIDRQSIIRGIPSRYGVSGIIVTVDGAEFVVNGVNASQKVQEVLDMES